MNKEKTIDINTWNLPRKECVFFRLFIGFFNPLASVCLAIIFFCVTAILKIVFSIDDFIVVMFFLEISYIAAAILFLKIN